MRTVDRLVATPLLRARTPPHPWKKVGSAKAVSRQKDNPATMTARLPMDRREEGGVPVEGSLVCGIEGLLYGFATKR